jgi:predicted ester cyclase
MQHSEKRKKEDIGRLSPDALIEHQRRTVEEHILQEERGNWDEVYHTFTSHQDDAYLDVVAFQRRFKHMEGVREFYETFSKAFMDFDITIHTEVDVPGVSFREAQVKATHKGEYCGIAPSGVRVSIPMAGIFVFDTQTGQLNAERVYFDNNTILEQIQGMMSFEGVFDLGRIEG